MELVETARVSCPESNDFKSNYALPWRDLGAKKSSSNEN